jgi:uncharacterized membrane protein YkoI
MRRSFWALLVAIAAVVSVTAADARPRGEGGFTLFQRGRDRGGPERLLPLEVVLGNVARQIPGHHLDANGPFPRGGRWIYRIKWLTPDGRVLIVIADAQTGQILDVR